jgi:hypothetical protein
MRNNRKPKKSAKPATNRHKRKYANIDPLGSEILRRYPGKFIVYSEDEKRVIGVGDTEAEAFDQAEKSGVQGLWHSAHSTKPGTYIV